MSSLLNMAFALLGLIRPIHQLKDLSFQTVVGSWHVVDMKQTFTDIKTGKVMDVNDMEPGMLDDIKKKMESNCDLMADHTVIMHSGFKGNKLLETKGTYTLEGDKLRFKGTTPNAFKAVKSGSPMIIPDFVNLNFEAGKMIWHYSVDTNEDGRTLRTDMYLIWQRK